MCWIRKIKFFFKKSENKGIKLSKRKQLENSSQEAVFRQKVLEKIQFDSFFFKNDKNPLFQTMRQFWNIYYLTKVNLIPCFTCPQILSSLHGKQTQFFEKKFVHSLELQNEECEAMEVKTTISEQVEGSTSDNSRSRQQIFSITNSVISVSLEI